MLLQYVTVPSSGLLKVLQITFYVLMPSTQPQQNDFKRGIAIKSQFSQNLHIPVPSTH